MERERKLRRLRRRYLKRRKREALRGRRILALAVLVASILWLILVDESRRQIFDIDVRAWTEEAEDVEEGADFGLLFRLKDGRLIFFKEERREESQEP